MILGIALAAILVAIPLGGAGIAIFRTAAIEGIGAPVLHTILRRLISGAFGS